MANKLLLMTLALLAAIYGIAQTQPGRTTEQQRIEQLEKKVLELELKVADIQKKLQPRFLPAR